MGDTGGTRDTGGTEKHELVGVAPCLFCDFPIEYCQQMVENQMECSVGPWKGVTQMHQGKKVHSFIHWKECIVCCNKNYFMGMRKHLNETHEKQPIPGQTYIIYTWEEDQYHNLQGCRRERYDEIP